MIISYGITCKTPLEQRNELALKIRAVRIAHRETQATAAKCSGVSLEAYGDLERGVNCDMTTFIKVLLHFGLLQDVADVIYQGTPPNEKQVRGKQTKTKTELAAEKFFAEAEVRNRAK